jgi:hypothetical protein
MGEHAPATMLVRPAELGDMQPVFPLDAHVCLRCGLIEVPDQMPTDFFLHHLRLQDAPQQSADQLKATDELLHGLAGDGLQIILCDDARLRPAPALATEKQSNAKAYPNRLVIAAASLDPATARMLRTTYGPAKAVIIQHGLQRVGDLHGLLESITRLLDDGTFVIETPWSCEALRRNAFDRISAEHLSLFSLRSIEKLCAYFDLTVCDVARLPADGGWIRAIIRRGNDLEPTPAVQLMREEELAAGILDAETYDAFAGRVNGIRDHILALLRGLKACGLRVAGYGAPESGNTLLNYFGVGRLELDFLADPDPHKHDMFSPGMKIPIRPIDAIAAERPDVLLVLDNDPDGFATAAQLGTRLLVPLPQPRLMN